MNTLRMGSAEVRIGDVPIGIATDIEMQFEMPEVPEFTRHPNCFSEVVYVNRPANEVIEDLLISAGMLPPKIKYWDVKAMPVYPDESAERYQMRRLLESIPLGGIVGDYAYLIVYNREAPERSYVIREGL